MGSGSVAVRRPRAQKKPPASAEDAAQQPVRTAGEKDRHRLHATLLGFLTKFRHLVPDCDDLASQDVEWLDQVAREKLQPYLTPAFRAFLDVAHLSGFRRTKELIHEASAQMDTTMANALAIQVARGAIREFPEVFDFPHQGMADHELTTEVARIALSWISAQGCYDEVEPFLTNTEVSAQLRLKRLILAIRKAIRSQKSADVSPCNSGNAVEPAMASTPMYPSQRMWECSGHYPAGMRSPPWDCPPAPWCHSYGYGPVYPGRYVEWH
mmetsp:Transcript_66467/g.177286  ORF Transcript_66467/g.177286 Transcript_66467/m.177286 type:complete len:268 (-) Transcript_66467:303-1106(-)